MSLNVNAKAWTPSFGAAAPAPPPSALAGGNQQVPPPPPSSAIAPTNHQTMHNGVAGGFNGYANPNNSAASKFGNGVPAPPQQAGASFFPPQGTVNPYGGPAGIMGSGFDPQVNAFSPYNPSAAPFKGPEQSEWFRYSIALPTARLAEVEPVASNSILALQTRRALIAGRTRDRHQLENYLENYFIRCRNSSVTQQQSQTNIAVQNATNAENLSAILLSRKKLEHPISEEEIAAITNCDGYLLQVVGSYTQPGADIQLWDVWQEFLAAVGPSCSAIGHWVLEVPEIATTKTSTQAQSSSGSPTNASQWNQFTDVGAAFYHYFFALPKTPTSLSSDELLHKFPSAQKVTKVRSLLSYIMNNRLPLAVRVRFLTGNEYQQLQKATLATAPPPPPTLSTVKSDTDILSTSDENRYTPFAGTPTTTDTKNTSNSSTTTTKALPNPPAPALTIKYDALNHQSTMNSLQEALTVVERYLMPIVGAPSDRTATNWTSTAIFNLDFVDVTAEIKIPSGAQTIPKGPFPPNNTLVSPCVTPAFDVIQELSAGLAALGGGMSHFERPNIATTTTASLMAPSSAALSVPVAAFLALLKPSVFVESNTDTSPVNGDVNRQLVVLSTRSALASPWGTLPSAFASGARLTPFMNTVAYSNFHKMATSCWEALCTAEYRSLALTTDKATIAAHVFAQEPYVARRTAVGARVLLLADRERQLAIFDPQTGSLLSIPSDSWSNRNAVIADSVFSATLAHSFRGGRTWRLIVDDVYRFNGEPCVVSSFKDRWQHLDCGILESEGSHGHGNPFGPIILHATYVNAHELHRLMDRTRHTAAPTNAEEQYLLDPKDGSPNPFETIEPVDHATLGLTFVPTLAPVVSFGSQGESGHYGSPLPPMHHKPRSINSQFVREALKFVPTFVWIPQESVRCTFAVGSIENEGKMSKIYLKATKSFITMDTTGPESEIVAGPPQLLSSVSADSLSALLPPATMLPTSANGNLQQQQNSASDVAKEPVLESHAKRIWLSWVTKHGNLVTPNALSDVGGGEYVEVPTAVLDLGYINNESVIECLLRRTGTARWWEYTKTIANLGSATPIDRTLQINFAPSTDSFVKWMFQQTYFKTEDLQWLPKAYLHRCGKCHDVSDKGERDPATGQYRCQACWKDSGYGDCVHCHKRFTPGSVDLNAKAFYCESCWQSFTHPVTIGYGPQPPPSNATLEQQVMTRVASLLIDELSKKFPLRDVLDLCVQDTSVIRKWLHAGIENFTGVATEASVVAEVNAVKAQFLNEHQNKSREHFTNFACPFAFTDTDRFWEETIVPRHPKQFSAIFCFYQLNKIFANKHLAKDYFKYLARALVPGGIFVTTFFCPNSFFSKGEPYYNDYFGIKWNIKEYEEQRARVFAAVSQPKSTTSSTSPVGATFNGRNMSTPNLVKNESGMGSATASAPAARHTSGTSTPIPSIDDDESGPQNDSILPPPPTPPHGGSKPVATNSVNGSVTPRNEPAPQFSSESLTAPVVNKALTSESSNDVKESASDSNNQLASAATPASTTTPLVPGKGAWRPKLSSSSLQSPSAPTANPVEASTPSSPVKNGQTASIPETPVVITTDLTIPTVGLSYRLSFTEGGGLGMGRENSSAMLSDSCDIPPTPVSQLSSADRYNSFLVNELSRSENVVPLDLLCACAEEAGFELLFDYWGKAGTLIANDGAWTKPLNPPAKEFFDNVKTIVFRKIAKRPHVNVSAPSAAPAAL